MVSNFVWKEGVEEFATMSPEQLWKWLGSPMPVFPSSTRKWIWTANMTHGRRSTICGSKTLRMANLWPCAGTRSLEC